VERHVAYFREKGTLREKPLTPGKMPLNLIDRFAKTTGRLYDNKHAAECNTLVANQILSLVDSVYRREEERGLKFPPGNNFDNRWKTVAGEVEKLDIRWSAEKGRYTLKDGSHLPDRVRKLYRRDIWKLEGLNGEAALIVERVSKRQVSVCLQWSWKNGVELPPTAVSVFAVKDKANAIAKLKYSPAAGGVSGSGTSAQTYWVELAEGEDIQLVLQIGNRKETSPVYTP